MIKHVNNYIFFTKLNFWSFNLFFIFILVIYFLNMGQFGSSKTVIILKKNWNTIFKSFFLLIEELGFLQLNLST